LVAAAVAAASVVADTAVTLPISTSSVVFIAAAAVGQVALNFRFIIRYRLLRCSSLVRGN